MIKKMKYWPVLFFCFILSACNGGGGNDSGGSTSNQMPFLPQEEIVAMIQAADDVDIIFSEHGASMNLLGGGAKQMMLGMMAKGEEYSACKEIFLMFVKSQGEQIAHIGVHMDESCAYFVTYQNNQRAYVNAMDQKGVKFFNMMLSQIQSNPQ